MIKEVIDWIKSFWRNKVEESLYDSVISGNSIKEYLRGLFGKHCMIEVEDNFYYTTTITKLKPVMSSIPVKMMRYVPERNDCDNYSRAFWGLCSILYPQLPVLRCNVIRDDGVYHSLNGVIYVTKTKRLQFYYIEPQNGKLFYANYKPYLVII